MSGKRNPFRLRTAENIRSQTEFLRFFGPKMLNILPKDENWNNLQTFESSPGGGKTTLFKLFTPNSLKRLVTVSQTDHDLLDLRKRLQSYGIVNEERPLILGVFLSCARNFAALEDLDLESEHSIRLFNALLNARIVLSTLRSLADYYGIDYPDNLERLNVNPSPDVESLPNLQYPESGKELFEWAYKTETEVCQELDSFKINANVDALGHQGLQALSLLEPGRISFKNEAMPSRTLLMLDDAHKLTGNQRRHLFEKITEYRADVQTWASQRRIALRPRDLMIPGATEGREYGSPIDIEDYWHTHKPTFHKLLGEIADRRIQHSSAVDITSFDGQLSDSLDTNKWKDNLSTARSTIEQRVRESTYQDDRFEEWIQETKEASVGPWEKVIKWRSLEINIQREENKSQQVLDVGVPLADEQLKNTMSSDIQNAAEKLLAEEFDFPYYYGPQRISNLSSYNVDQYLSLSGNLFEEIISQHLLGDRSPLSPKDQDDIVREWADLRWDELPRQVPRGNQVKQFLESISEMCRDKWEEGTASYGAAGALTGIGIRNPEIEKILGEADGIEDDRFIKCRQVLMVCIANNLLEARTKRKQGREGQEVLILYLNRWVCVKFDLPLLYGGWREKNARDLEKWIPNKRVV